ncbi:hypothetical protein HY479_00570 [Candidatus Uhrbacteria bacterium]|nr:hypothetical protein [Candidatus Uhrbacteria bacterium]
MKFIRTKVNFKDARGEIRDILTHVAIDSVTSITCATGAIRGNHYHKKTTQYTYILSGKLMSYGRKGMRGKVVKKIVKAGDLLMHGPNEAHAFKAIEPSHLLQLGFGPRRGDDYELDTFRLEKPLV